MAVLSVGMLAPSSTYFTPAFTKASASAWSISFWVAQGMAMSYLAPSICHGFWPAMNLPAHQHDEVMCLSIRLFMSWYTMRTT